MVDVLVEPAMDSSVTSLGTVSAPLGVVQSVVVSVCWVIGTQLTVAQDPSATIMDVLDGKDRATPTRFRLSPPLVRYVYTPGVGSFVRSEDSILPVCSLRYMRSASRRPTGEDTVRKTSAQAVPPAQLTMIRAKAMTERSRCCWTQCHTNTRSTLPGPGRPTQVARPYVGAGERQFPRDQPR